MAEGMSLQDAARLAVRAASVSVTRRGAQAVLRQNKMTPKGEK
jgi:sugar/nucleoside kinase (ribokinase family)